MSFLSFVPIIGNLLDKIIPDKDAAAKAKAELAVMEQKGELDLMLKQLEVNTEEAKHSSMFVAGWRPFIGWVCGIAFAYHFILAPLIAFIAQLHGVTIDLPAFDMSALTTVLLGMLGLGGLRTYEKFKGVARNKL